MKKLAILLCAILSACFLAGCGASHEYKITIGDGNKVNDGVSVQLKYGDSWKNGEKIFTVNYGHESEAVLAEEYSLSFSDSNPNFSDNVTLKTIFSFQKSDLEGRTVEGSKFFGKASEIKIDDLSAYLPQGEADETCTVYLVFSSSDTDFENITTYNVAEFNYVWQDNGVKLTD